MPGPFVFFDLRTRDAAASRRFYEAFGGWRVEEVAAGPTRVPLLADAAGVWGGFTELEQADERNPQWIPYLPVEDVDSATERAVGLGADVVRPRVDLPAGSAVVVTDPGGAAICLWQPRTG